MKKDKLSEGYRLLENKGWSDLIDRKWRDYVIKDLQEVDGITDEEINEILETVLW